jgi:hypothetical protein
MSNITLSRLLLLRVHGVVIFICVSEWVSEWGIILYHQVSTCSAISWWEHVTFQWDEDDDIHCAFHNHTLLEYSIFLARYYIQSMLFVAYVRVDRTICCPPFFFFFFFIYRCCPPPLFFVLFVFLNIDFFSYKQHFATFYVSLYDIYTINTIKQ